MIVKKYVPNVPTAEEQTREAHQPASESRQPRKYPYLGKCTINDRSYTVLFSEEDTGTVVHSDFTDKPNLAFGKIGNFDESMFVPLEEGLCVRINN